VTEKVLAKELDNELMLYDSETDNVHVLNPTARHIYEEYRKGKALHEIEQSLRKSFRISGSTDISADIESYLSEMKKRGLI